MCMARRQRRKHTLWRLRSRMAHSRWERRREIRRMSSVTKARGMEAGALLVLQYCSHDVDGHAPGGGGIFFVREGGAGSASLSEEVQEAGPHWPHRQGAGPEFNSQSVRKLRMPPPPLCGSCSSLRS
jgi:hypothetical protein